MYIYKMSHKNCFPVWTMLKIVIGFTGGHCSLFEHKHWVSIWALPEVSRNLTWSYVIWNDACIQIMDDLYEQPFHPATLLWLRKLGWWSTATTLLLPRKKSRNETAKKERSAIKEDGPVIKNTHRTPINRISE